jgi:hypothetical protein
MEDSMHTNFRLVSICILVIVLVLLFAGFHSYTYNIAFLSGLYFTITTIIAQLWQVLVNPVILLALAVYGFLLLNRPQLPRFMSGIRKLQLGPQGFGIELDLESDRDSKSQTVVVPKANSNLIGTDVLSTIINNLNPNLCKILLKVANKDLTVAEFLDAIGSTYSHETRGNDVLRNTLDDMFNFGVFAGIIYLDPLLFNLKSLDNSRISSKSQSVRLQISQEALELLKKKLNQTAAVQAANP